MLTTKCDGASSDVRKDESLNYGSDSENSSQVEDYKLDSNSSSPMHKPECHSIRRNYDTPVSDCLSCYNGSELSAMTERFKSESIDDELKTVQGSYSKDGLRDNIGVRRYRTAFSREQMSRLEKEFCKENYVSRPRRCELARELNLPENTIKVWFQNQRMKDKRQRVAMVWPYGIADPHVYAYLAAVAAAASYPYGLPTTTPANYYHSIRPHRPSVPTFPTTTSLGSFGQYLFSNPLRLIPESLPGMPHAFTNRSPGVSQQHPFHSSPMLGRLGTQSLNTSPFFNGNGTLSSSGSSLSPQLDESLGYNSTYGNSSDLVSPTQHSPNHMSHNSNMLHFQGTPKLKPTLAPQVLFRPFDIDRT